MNENDKFLKKPEILPILKIGRNKLYDLIKSGEFIKPVYLPGVKIDLYSHNELQDWMDEQKRKAKENIKRN
jgi:predicted DNA-binding transcriptional regulator AlpA